jgi:hypothetical protein
MNARASEDEAPARGVSRSLQRARDVLRELQVALPLAGDSLPCAAAFAAAAAWRGLRDGRPLERHGFTQGQRAGLKPPPPRARVRRGRGRR